VLAELATDMVLLEFGKLLFEECFGNSQLSHIVLWKRNLFSSLGVLSLRALSAERSRLWECAHTSNSLKFLE
jgi:hypothetical protein